MILRWLRQVLTWIMAMLLLPPVGALGQSFMDGLMRLDPVVPGRLIAFMQGVMLYVVIHIALWKPRSLYLLGHRILQRLLEAVLGGQVRATAVPGGLPVAPPGARPTQGAVVAAVSPALIPIYTLLITLTLGILRASDMAGVHDRLLLAIVGISTAFHVLMAIDTLQETRAKQSFAGYVLTVELVCLSTLIVTTLCLAFLLPHLSIGRLLQQAFHHTLSIYSSWFHQLF